MDESGESHNVQNDTFRRIREFPLRSAVSVYLAESRSILSIAWAIIITSFLQFFMQSISVIMCGHLSTIELDSVALANTLINVLGVSIIGGMSTAFDTFFSQTYGSDNKKGVGVYLQRAIILSYLVLVCLYCIHINIEPILVLLGQDKLKARMAAEYIVLVLPGLFFDFNFQTLAKYLQNQGRVVPPMLCAAVGNVVNSVSQYLCLYVFHYTYRSSAVCQSVSFGVMFALELSYILISGVYKETWDGWRFRQAMEGWGEFMRIAVPGILLIAFESWCFEVGVLISGVLGTIQMAAQAVIFQLETWTFMLHFGLSIAVTIRVGQNLGALKPGAAATAYRAALLLSLSISTAVAILVFFLRFYLPLIFTRDAEVVEATVRILPIFCFFNTLVGIAHITSGALRGCGKQMIGAVMVFIGYYLVGLPVGIYLALGTSLKVMGFWIGLSIANLLQAASFVLYISCKLDWGYEMQKAVLRVSSSSSGLQQDTISPSGSGTQASVISMVETERKSDTVNIDSQETSSHGSQNKQYTVHITCLIITIILLLFAGSILLRIYLPKSWRQKCLELTEKAPKYSPIPACNATGSPG